MVPIINGSHKSWFLRGRDKWVPLLVESYDCCHSQSLKLCTNISFGWSDSYTAPLGYHKLYELYRHVMIMNSPFWLVFSILPASWSFIPFISLMSILMLIPKKLVDGNPPEAVNRYSVNVPMNLPPKILNKTPFNHQRESNHMSSHDSPTLLDVFKLNPINSQLKHIFPLWNMANEFPDDSRAPGAPDLGTPSAAAQGANLGVAQAATPCYSLVNIQNNYGKLPWKIMENGDFSIFWQNR